MGRKHSPSKPTVSPTLPRGHGDFWKVIRDLDASQGSLTIADVNNKTAGGVHPKSVRDYILRLLRAGYLEQSGTRPGEQGRVAKAYRLVKKPKTAPRLRRDGTECHVETKQDRLWRTMKILGKFTINDLAVGASIDTSPVPRRTAKRYVVHLVAAGYLSVRHQGGSNPGIFHLKQKMNRGPLAPQILRTHCVWDPNLKQVLSKGLTIEEMQS